jgi:hypothetical protein
MFRSRWEMGHGAGSELAPLNRGRLSLERMAGWEWIKKICCTKFLLYADWREDHSDHLSATSHTEIVCCSQAPLLR